MRKKKCGSEPGGSPLPRGKGVVGGTTPRIVILIKFFVEPDTAPAAPYHSSPSMLPSPSILLRRAGVPDLPKIPSGGQCPPYIVLRFVKPVWIVRYSPGPPDYIFILRCVCPSDNLQARILVNQSSAVKSLIQKSSLVAAAHPRFEKSVGNASREIHRGGSCQQADAKFFCGRAL
jgi:hypothetical protein